MSSNDATPVREDSSTSADPLAAITTERDQLVADKAELQDRFLRSQAEFQNFRKRVERERIELFEYAGMEAVRELLPILDNFERAVLVASADEEYAKGMNLIYQGELLRYSEETRPGAD